MNAVVINAILREFHELEPNGQRRNALEPAMRYNNVRYPSVTPKAKGVSSETANPLKIWWSLAESNR